MGALGNHDHERFCQAAHSRIWAGERRAKALPAAYRETMYGGKEADDAALAPNARRLANRVDVAARLRELDDYAAKLAGIDAGWALLKLKRLAEDIEGFNLDDFLSVPSTDGSRYFDLSKVPADKLRLLSEIGIEDETKTILHVDDDAGKTVMDVKRRVQKIKLKGPAKADLVGPIALMARIAGWEAPKKIAPTDKDGNDLKLGDAVAASMALVMERRQAAQKPAAAV